MAKGHLLIILLVAFALPCVEVPEWLTSSNDPSNDFVLITSKADSTPLHIIKDDPAIHIQNGCVWPTFVAPHPNSTTELLSVTGRELLAFFSLQRK